MNRTLAFSLLAACASFALIGCTSPQGESDDEEELVGVSEQALGDNPPTGKNHFLPWHFWADDTQQAYRTMGAGPLNAGSGRLPVLTIASAYRNDVLQNAVECALNQSQTITDPVTGQIFRGWWGIATTWYSAPLTTSQRRWVTACMAQRLNATGAHVPILLEGNTSAIYRSPANEPDFPFDDSNVWGDLFSSAAPLNQDVAPFNLYTCWDNELASYCIAPNTATNWLRYRICDSSPKCGLIPLGPCADPAICTIGSSGYPTCKVPGGGGLYTEVVHVQVPGGNASCYNP